MIQAESIQCALHDRIFALQINQEEHSWRGILLTSGSGVVRAATGETPFAATTLVWGPWTSDMSLWIDAGSVGVQFALSADSLSNAIGHNSESSELRLLADRLIAVQFERANVVIQDCEHAFDLILREFGNRQSGSISMIEAQVRAILVLLWRNTTRQETHSRSVGRTEAILQHYRQLVETHFRDHWSVKAYAEKIGISPDRLHDICSRNLQKTPSKLLHERIVHEACLMLENTTLSVDQLSGALGFRDVTYFSRFFSSRTGVPPAAYRRRAIAGLEQEITQDIKGFSDWP